MATTPEGKVKADIRKVMDQHADVWHWMPVTNGMGKPGLDFIGAVRAKGFAAMFAVEAKAPGKTPTPRQLRTIADMEAVGIKVFVIDGEPGLTELSAWLTQMEHFNNGSRC